jgi:hypothetical protein
MVKKNISRKKASGASAKRQERAKEAMLKIAGLLDETVSPDARRPEAQKLATLLVFMFEKKGEEALKAFPVTYSETAAATNGLPKIGDYSCEKSIRTQVAIRLRSMVS